MTTRHRVSADEVKRRFMSRAGTGLIHDHQTGEVVAVMDDGTEYACSFEEHSALLEADK